MKDLLLPMPWPPRWPRREGWRRGHERRKSSWHGTVEGWDHCWLRLADGRIIDPTADQFGNGMPKVYIGTLPAGYKEEPRKFAGVLKGPLATVLVARVKALRHEQAERRR